MITSECFPLLVQHSTYLHGSKLASYPYFSQVLEAQNDCTILVWQENRTVNHLNAEDTTAQIISLSPQWPHIHVKRRDDRMKPCGIPHEREPSGLMSNYPMPSSGISLRGKSGTTQVQSHLPQPRSTGESEKHHDQRNGQKGCWQKLNEATFEKAFFSDMSSLSASGASVAARLHLGWKPSWMVSEDFKWSQSFFTRSLSNLPEYVILSRNKF